MDQYHASVHFHYRTAKTTTFSRNGQHLISFCKVILKREELTNALM